MTYTGHVENGAIVLDAPLDLPEGTRIRIEVEWRHEEPAQEIDCPTLAERLKDVIGVLDDMPADWSENHDYYLRKEHSRRE